MNPSLQWNKRPCNLVALGVGNEQVDHMCASINVGDVIYNTRNHTDCDRQSSTQPAGLLHVGRNLTIRLIHYCAVACLLVSKICIASQDFSSCQRCGKLLGTAYPHELSAKKQIIHRNYLNNSYSKIPQDNHCWHPML